MGRRGYPAEFRRKVLDLLADGTSVARRQTCRSATVAVSSHAAPCRVLADSPPPNLPPGTASRANGMSWVEAPTAAGRQGRRSRIGVARLSTDRRWREVLTTTLAPPVASPATSSMLRHSVGLCHFSPVVRGPPVGRESDGRAALSSGTRIKSGATAKGSTPPAPSPAASHGVGWVVLTRARTASGRFPARSC